MDVNNVSASDTPHYLIGGGMPLSGEVSISGAKNAVTKMIIASLLTSELCTLRNVPLLGDLDLTVKLCEDLGSEVSIDDHKLFIRTPHVHKTAISNRVGGLNRIAVMKLGAFAPPCREVTLPK